MKVLDFLICNTCKSHSLDISNVKFEKQIFSGHVVCNKCSSDMKFVDGVLDLTDNLKLNNISKRNKQVYSDLWDRSEDLEVEENITSEDQLIKSWYPTLKGTSFLDVGCGNGRHLNHWLLQDFESFIFVDVSDAIIECSKKFHKLNTKNKYALFIKSSIDNIPIKKKTIDTVWSSGTLGLVDDQKKSMEVLVGITKGQLHLSVLTDKNFVGKMYIMANVLKPLINRVDNLKYLYLLSGVFAKIIIYILRGVCLLGIDSKLFPLVSLKKLLRKKNSIRRLQWAIYDPIIIPRVIKKPDAFYFEIAHKAGLRLRAHTTELISDYYYFQSEDKTLL